MTGERPAQPRSRWERFGKRALGALLALDLFALLFALSLANVTAAGPAQRTLRYSLAITFEVDTYVDQHYDPLRQQAATSGQPIILPDLPLDISVSPSELLASDRAGFRALLLDRAAEQVHARGVSVLRQDGHSGSGLSSVQDLTGVGMDFLRPTPHRALTGITFGLAVAAGLLAAGLGLSVRRYGRLVAIGLCALMAALPFLLAAVAVRFAFHLAADGVDDYFVREFATLGQALTWAAIRNGIIFAVGGGVFLAAGSALSIWDRGPRA